MPKKLIIGISVALVLVGAVILTVLLVRSRALTDEVDAGPTGASSETTGPGSLGGSGSSLGGTQQGGTDAVTGSTGGEIATGDAGTAPICGDGACSAGETQCTPDCGDKNQRFFGSALLVESSQDAITLSWETDSPSTAEARWGLTDRYELGSASTRGPALANRLTLTGLSPGTNYLARLKVTEEDGDIYEASDLSFETLGR